ncbi:MAG: phage major capsid protein [Oscillospiraceae bacterium]|nr:phage major capsid protein [Oscillospiraceae bacterium]
MPSGIQTNRTAISLPAELSREIMQVARDQSVIMQMARRVVLPGRGLDIPTITGDPEAEWITETDAKPVKNPGVGMKNMKGYTLAVILPFSMQFRRDLPGLYDNILARLPGALGKKFDQTVLGAVAKPGAAFDNFASTTTQSIVKSVSADAYDGLVAARKDIAEHSGIVDGWALSPQAEALLLEARDQDGRPLFINNVAEAAIPRILGAPTKTGRGLYVAGSAAGDSTAGSPDIVGVVGDWSQAQYGIVEDIQISFADQATLTYTNDQNETVTINLWQRNMFAVRCEFEAGFIANTSVFNRLTGETPT